MIMELITKFLFICSIVLTITSASRVLELSDRFRELRDDGQWFIMLYAPWCGHCKRTEPIWAHVAQSLYNTNVRVGRIDCTRFPIVAQQFGINSYPTIIFIKGKQEYIYTGDRSKEDLLTFAFRMSGPPVQSISQIDSISNIKVSNPVFFTYVGSQSGQLWESFHTIAEHFQPHGSFFVTNERIARSHFDLKKSPSILVYKENNHFIYPYSDDFEFTDLKTLNSTLFEWINQERFAAFPKVTRSNLHQLIQTRKYLVLAVVEENKLSEISGNELEFRNLIESIIRLHGHKYHSLFQFGWVGSPEIAHSIIMDQLPTPHLLVLNSTTSEHHIPDDDPSQLTAEAIHMFLENISFQKATAYGGNSLWVRFYRSYFEAKRSLSDMWRGNPVLTSVLFGLPLGFLSLIIYSICCADILDADPEDDEVHEKNE